MRKTLLMVSYFRSVSHDMVSPGLIDVLIILSVMIPNLNANEVWAQTLSPHTIGSTVPSTVFM